MPGHPSIPYTCPCCGGKATYVGTCSDRTCVDCAKRRRSRLIKRYSPVAQSLASWKDNAWFVTLTLPRQRLNKSLIKRIRGAWKKFQSPDWSGMYQIEIGSVRRAGGLKFATANVHIHALIEGFDLSWEDAVSAWYGATDGQAFIVDCENVRSPRRAAWYLTKHMIKRAWRGEDDDWIKAQVNDALKGVRLIHLFGRVYGERLRYDGQRPLCGDCGAEMVPNRLFDATETSPARVPGPKRHYSRLLTRARA